MPGVIGVDLASMLKFRQQVCRRHSMDTFVDEDTFKVVSACLQIEPTEYGEQFVGPDRTALDYTCSTAIKLI